MLYELMHLARALFGVLVADALYMRGSGRNGKDTARNALASIGGTYVTSVSCDARQMQNADSPSPTFASLRARRLICVREVLGRSQKVLSGSIVGDPRKLPEGPSRSQ